MYQQKLVELEEDTAALKFALQDELKAQDSDAPSQEKGNGIMSRLKKLGVVEQTEEQHFAPSSNDGGE